MSTTFTPSLREEQLFKQLIKKSYEVGISASDHDLLRAGFIKDFDLSNSETGVYSKFDVPYIVHRGTNTGELKSFINDVGTDFYLALGKLKSTRRYKRTLQVVKAARIKYPKSGVHIGHSLGGSLAEVFRKKGERSYTLNKGVGLGDIGRTISTKQIDVKHPLDIISFLNFTQKSKNRKSHFNGSFNPLRILYNHSVR